MSSKLAPSCGAALEAVASSLPAGSLVTCDQSLTIPKKLGWTAGPVPHELFQELSALATAEGAHFGVSIKGRPIHLEEGLAVRDELRRTGPLTREALRTPALLDALLLAVRSQEEQRKLAPAPTNADGDPVFLGADRYELRADPDAIAGLLAAQRPDVLQGEEAVFTLTRLGNPQHPSWRRTIMASMALDKKRLTVEANSERRLDYARQWLERVVGERVRFVERTPTVEPLPSGRFDAQPIVQGPWLDLLRTLEVRSTWLGEKAARLHSTDARVREEARREAHVAIARFERDEHAPGEGLDLRRAIGLSWRGEWLGPDTTWLRLGAGIPLSLALPTISAPLLDELKGDKLTCFSDAVRLAWAAWTVAREPGSVEEAATLAWRRLEPTGQGTQAEGEALSPALPPGSANLELIRSVLPWAIARTRLLFPLDRRVVHEVRLELTKQEVRCHAFGTPEGMVELETQGHRLGDLPCQRFDDLTLDSGFAWRETPPAWRRELVADHLRSEGGVDGDFAGEVARRVAMEDALLERQDEGLRAACKLLEERTKLSHLAAVSTLARLAGEDPSFADAPSAAVDRLLAAHAFAHAKGGYARELDVAPTR